MRPEDLIRIRHMIEAGEAALDFASQRKREELGQDRMLLFALVRAIEIIGEAASKVTPETRLAVPAVPWQIIVSMRNRLIHAYFDIDPDILWTTVTDELPNLLPLLRHVLSAGNQSIT